MKRYYKYSVLLLLLLGVATTSCVDRLCLSTRGVKRFHSAKRYAITNVGANGDLVVEGVIDEDKKNHMVPSLYLKSKP